MAGDAYPAACEGGAWSWLSGSTWAGAPAAHSEMTYDDADAFSVTAGGFLLIQRQYSGEQKDLAVFAPSAWLHAEVVREPAPGSR